MCIIVLNKKGLIPENTLKTCYESNPDGMGLMYAKNGRIKIIKELTDFDKFYVSYMKIRIKHKGNIALHFRIRTAGNVNEKNLHPFFVNQNLAFMHNGILDIDVPIKSKVSDTIIFNEHILKNLPNDFLNYHGNIELIKNYITHSKLLFMDSYGDVTIINEDEGNWLKDNWYSNFSYCAEQYHIYSDVCDNCQNYLFTNEEYYSGLCNKCSEDYEEKCPECNNDLTEDEIEDEYCESCQTLYYQKFSDGYYNSNQHNPLTTNLN